MEIVHDSRRRINGTPPHWGHSLGVLVYNHAGLGNVKAIEWQVETPIIWSSASGGFIPFDQKEKKAVEATTYCIERIDAAIAELEAQRRWLTSTLTIMQSKEVQHG